MIKAVLFDMNGVIIDDEQVHELAFKELLKPFHLDVNHQIYLDCCAGRTAEEGFYQLSRKFSIQLPIQQLIDQKSKFYQASFPTHQKTFPGVIELIHELTHDFTLALTSSARRADIDLVTKTFDIRAEFKVIVSADDVTSGKPDPEPYLLTVEKLGLNPSQCVVIEDSKNGIASAKGAGCYCIGISTSHPKSELALADIVVATFPEITPQLIQSLPA